MTTQPALYLSPSNFEAAQTHLRNCVNFPCEIGDHTLDEIEELDAQIVADLVDLDDVGLPDAEEGVTLEIDHGGRIWAEVYEETTDEDGEPTGDCQPRRIQVLPQPVPGSWYDPALDPSNAAPPVAADRRRLAATALTREERLALDDLLEQLWDLARSSGLSLTRSTERLVKQWRRSLAG